VIACGSQRHIKRAADLRRADPERISEAQLAGVRARLLGTGLQPETADRWFDAWVLEAATRDRLRDGAYRTAACDGITA
jgi:hypothetical protein